MYNHSIVCNVLFSFGNLGKTVVNYSNKATCDKGAQEIWYIWLEHVDQSIACW